jgi:hypothetical protein
MHQLFWTRGSRPLVVCLYLRISGGVWPYSYKLRLLAFCHTAALRRYFWSATGWHLVERIEDIVRYAEAER